MAKISHTGWCVVYLGEIKFCTIWSFLENMLSVLVEYSQVDMISCRYMVCHVDTISDPLLYCLSGWYDFWSLVILSVRLMWYLVVSHIVCHVDMISDRYIVSQVDMISGLYIVCQVDMISGRYIVCQVDMIFGR